MNFDRSYTMSVPGSGLAVDEYEIAASIIDADVWINIPVAKVHGAKITCAMKNHFGLLPGTVYGWSKARGTPDHGPLPHSPNFIDEAFVDPGLNFQAGRLIQFACRVDASANDTRVSLTLL